MANGNFAGGDGTKLSPYLIEDAHDLDGVRNNLLAYYKLVMDIDLGVSPYIEDEGWNPIVGFNGSIDGKGFSIYNLYINRPKSNKIGLFSTTGSNAKILNVSLLGIKIKGNNEVGGLVGATIDGEIQGNVRFENILLEGEVEGNSNVGGAIGYKGGYRYSPAPTFKNFKILVKVTGASAYGGIIGHFYSNVPNNRANSFEKSLYAYGVDILLNFDPIAGSYRDNGAAISRFPGVFAVSNTESTSALPGLIISEEQAKTEQTYVEKKWNLELNDNGDPVWILKDGKYPKLWFEVERYILIKSNEKYYTYKNKRFIEVDPIEENFKNYSINLMDLLIANNQGIKPIMRLENPEIVLLTDKENPSLYIKGFRDLRPLMESDNPKVLIHSEVEPEINVTFIPDPQLIIPTGDITLKMLNKIHNFTIHSNKNNSGDIKIVFSVDKGVNWLTYNLDTDTFEEIDITKIKEVKQKGIDCDTFNSINEKWNEVILNNKIRFAYYLEIECINNIAEVDKLEIKMDMHGRWKKAEPGDYSYEYDNEHLYVSFFKDGSYKINYQG